MSSHEPAEHERAPEEGEPSKGPNLVLIYSLLGAAFIAAIAISVLIVLPFYHRR